MLGFSQSDSEISQHEEDFNSEDRIDYQTKINHIWQHIQKTKNIDPSDDETYQMYRNKKIGLKPKQQLEQKYNNPIQKKVINSLNPKRLLSSSVQKKRTSLNEKYDLSIDEIMQKELQTRKAMRDSEMQEKLQKSKQNTNILMKKLIQAEQQIEYLEYELQKQITEKQLLLAELNKKTQRYLTQKQNRLDDRNRNTEKQQLQSRVLMDKYKLRLKVAEKDIQEKNTQLYALQNEIRKLNSEIQEYRINQKNYIADKNIFKGSELLELNEAYKTIERLVTLLKSTEEYRLLGSFAQEVKSLHFLNKIPKQIKSELSSIKVASKSKQRHAGCGCTQIKINERLLWTPMLCYKKMLEMKIKYDTLNQDCIEEVLFEMNKLYLSKQQSRVSKVKTSYEAEIQKLKKKTQTTYDEMLAKKQIERLKKQLHTSKIKSKTTSKKPTYSNAEQRTNIVANPNLTNLRIIGQYEDQLKLKQKQIKLLTERIKLLENQTSSYDKSLYMEGVLWIIDKILEQLDTNSEDIREFESNFRNKMDSASSTDDWIRLFKEFFEFMQELNHALIQKILTIKETTVNKITYSKLS